MKRHHVQVLEILSSGLSKFVIENSYMLGVGLKDIVVLEILAFKIVLMKIIVHLV